MSAKHKVVRARRSKTTKGFLPRALLHCGTTAVGKDVQALLTGEPSFLGNMWSAVKRWLGDVPLC